MPPPLTPGFVSGEDFAFAAPADSPKGVMTRRRTSIYVAAKSRGSAAPAPLASTSRGKMITARAAPIAKEKKAAVAKTTPPKRGRRSVAPTAATVRVPAPPQLAPVSRAKKTAPEKPKRKAAPLKKVASAKVNGVGEENGMSNPTPAMLALMEKKRLAENAEPDLTRDVQVVVERLENTPGYKKILVNREEVRQRLEAVRTSPLRVQIVCDSLAEEEATKSPPKTPKSSRTTRGAIKRSTPHPNQAAKKKLFAPADDKSSPAPTTNMRAPPPLGTPQLADPTALLKLNLKHKVQEQMEERVSKMPNTSPYTIMEGEKESGSPDYMFTKLKGKPRADAKHLTSTPGNSKARGRLVLGSISNRSVPTPVVRRNLSIRDLNSPSDDEEDENENEVSFASKENASPSTPSSPMSPQPQLVTGDLGRMCAIM